VHVSVQREVRVSEVTKRRFCDKYKSRLEICFKLTAHYKLIKF